MRRYRITAPDGSHRFVTCPDDQVKANTPDGHTAEEHAGDVPNQSRPVLESDSRAPVDVHDLLRRIEALEAKVK